MATAALLLLTVAAVSSYAAISLKTLNGQLGESIKAESAAKEKAQINEREAIKARDLEAEARKKAENLVRLALQQNRNALDSQRHDQHPDLPAAARYPGHPGSAR